MTEHRIFLVGATGVFGRRLARQLARIENAILIVASRDADRARALAEALRSEFQSQGVDGVGFDKTTDLDHLKTFAPWLVIDASGPFQGGDYALARSSLEAGAHFIDLADARDHVLGFAGALDGLARAKNVAAVTGASSTPALSSAVVDELAEGWRRIDAIEAAITPGGASEVGINVIEAILSYAGRPIPIWSTGRLSQIRGWGTAEKWNIPGLGQRWVSPVETPDAELLSRHFNVRESVRFLAGLEFPLEHFGLLALSHLPGGIPSPKATAKILHGTRRLTRPFCSDKGGMVVRVSGLDDNGAPTSMQWSLLAENDDGPNVPTLAAVATTRALLSSRIKPGARPCVGVVTLAEIEREMANFAISTRREPWGGLPTKQITK
ncbi:saccharopine dehydrogenase NADP-binding domain-containing protein [Rhodoblastus sp.]|uniref:saccharopine dehydrogenase family protein n=1 Tax=Rhodoblastus sp. TaxID=1962975 RepID=UPI0035B40A16